jgi:flagellar motility protein MotE (MotC chaperone)
MAKGNHEGKQAKNSRLKVILPVFFLLLIAAGVLWYLFAPPGWPLSGNRQEGEKSMQALEKETDALRQEVARLQDANRQLENQVEQLNRQLSEQQVKGQQDEQRAAPEEQYRQLKATANLYSKMSPSKAAAILQAMPRAEAALILKAMSDRERSRILPRFDPQTAAQFTLAIQEIPPLDEKTDLDLVRTRLAQALPASSSVPAAQPVTAADMAQTLAAMEPEPAADILQQWWNRDRTGTLEILRSMNPGSRARIMAALDADVATDIGRQLVRGSS